jgi:hypothetical protein
VTLLRAVDAAFFTALRFTIIDVAAPTVPTARAPAIADIRPFCMLVLRWLVAADGSSVRQDNTTSTTNAALKSTPQAGRCSDDTASHIDAWGRAGCYRQDQPAPGRVPSRKLYQALFAAKDRGQSGGPSVPQQASPARATASNGEQSECGGFGNRGHYARADAQSLDEGGCQRANIPRQPIWGEGCRGN